MMYLARLIRAKRQYEAKGNGCIGLFAVLFFSACGENPVIDLSNITRKNTEETANSSNQEEGAAVINGNANAAPAPAQEPGQETQGMEPFDRDVFDTHRAAWEAEHPDAYVFGQAHKRSGIALYMSASTTVVDDIPNADVSRCPLLIPGLPEHEWYPMLKDNTISDLYEKIDVLWTEQCNSNTSGLLLIEYDGQRHYPKHIQIRNINGSGYNYTVRIGIMYEEDMTEVHW